MTENDKAWEKFARELNDTLEEREAQYRLVFLPEKDLIPYYGIGECTELEDRIDEAQTKWRDRKRQLRKNHINPNTETAEPLQLEEEKWDTISKALLVYKAALMAVHGKRHRAPVKTVIWEDDFGEGGTGYAKCPECHELAYGLDEADENGIARCPFCGQRYQLDEEGKKKMEPNPEETLTCPQCHQNTMVGRRAKSNGHFHGKCTNCGCVIME